MSSSTTNTNTNSATKKLINLTSSANHAAILFATDEWFATADNLLNPTPPVFVPDLFCDQGKVMDGWETRRKRTAGHDFCIIKLSSGLDDVEHTGRVHDRAFMVSMIELDTAYFTGNQAPRVSIEAMKVTRHSLFDREDDTTLPEEEEHDNEDYLYSWLPGASTRLSRGGGGKGIRGTGQSETTIQHVLQACKDVSNNSNGDWITILPITPLQPGYEESRLHHFEIQESVKRAIEELGGVTHLKLNYYPDGGVARMKVYGYPCNHHNDDELKKKKQEKEEFNSTTTISNAPIIHPHSDTSKPAPSTLAHPFPELSSETNGGIGLACSNKHYGVPSNLLRPYPGKDMGDGWETARHPNRPSIVSKDPMTGLQITPLLDWCVIKLGFDGGAKNNEGISRIIVDTRHFKGNFPESVTIDGCFAQDGVSDDDVCNSAGVEEYNTNGVSSNKQQPNEKQDGRIEWFPLLKRTLLTADAEHEFVSEHDHIVNCRRGVTHIRVSITPDGGLSRVRVYGSPAVANASLQYNSRL